MVGWPAHGFSSSALNARGIIKAINYKKKKNMNAVVQIKLALIGKQLLHLHLETTEPMAFKSSSCRVVDPRRIM